MDIVFLKNFFEKLNEAIPPNENQRHNITYNSNIKRVQLTLMLPDRIQPLILYDSDISKPTDLLIEDIKNAIG